MKPVLGIVLEYGFHEVKKYIHSGLAILLSERFRIVWIALDKKSDLFDSYFNSIGERIIYISQDGLIRPNMRLERINALVRRNWIINKDLGGFHNYVLLPRKSFKSRILGKGLFKYLLENLTFSKSKIYYNHGLEELLKDNGVQKILISSYSSLLVKNIAATVQKLDVGLYLIINSWKDLYINNYIPFNNTNRIFVWDAKMKSDYLFHMPYLSAEKIVISGNPSFDYLIQSKYTNNREYYCRKYNISTESKWIYYTMMPPGIFNDEIRTILFVANMFFKNYGVEYILLVRRNPNHKSSEFESIEFPQNVRITEHYCSFDENLDMLLQTNEGEQEWLDLLHHTFANFSVPSTVTLEFLLLGKRVFNLSFNSSDKQEQTLIQFFESGFYRYMFDNENVVRVNSIQHLMSEMILYDGNPVQRNLVKAADVIVNELMI